MTSARRETWGTTRAGEAVELVTLEAGALRARLASFGATLVSLEVPDRRGERADVVLGFDSLAGYDSPRNPYFGGVVGRVANRIRGARFELEGREVRLAANEGPNHLHGGARGFDRRAWALERATRSEVSFRLRGADGEEGYPGELDVLATYALAEDALSIELVATARAPTVAALTQHTYFDLAGGGSILGHELEVAASRRVVVDDALLPTGELAGVAGTPFDFRAPRRVGERIAELERTSARGYDVCYVLDGGAGRPAARLCDPASGRTLELATDQPGLQLYTGNGLDGVAGKRGARYDRFAGLCLETQHLPDAVHHAHFPSIVLRPGASARSTTMWRFSVL